VNYELLYDKVKLKDLSRAIIVEKIDKSGKIYRIIT